MENVVRRRPTADPAYPNTRILRCAFTGYRPEKMPFSEDEEDESYIRFREQQHKVINRLI